MVSKSNRSSSRSNPTGVESKPLNNNKTIIQLPRFKFKPFHFLKHCRSLALLSIVHEMTPSCMLWMLLLQILLKPNEIAAEVTALIVFGDSTVDAGNNDYIPTIARSNFEPYGRDFNGGKPTGRFSNGRIPTDFMSEALGLPPTVPAYLDPTLGIDNFTTGVCFASAGSGYDNATSNVFSVIALWKQLEHFKDYQRRLEAFLGKEMANHRLSEALYVMSLGTNDFLENYYTMPGRSSRFTVQQYQDFLLGIAERFITDIYHLGARKLDLTSLPPMGCLPMERLVNLISQNSCNEEYNQVAMAFNFKLQSLAENLNKKLPNMTIAYGNVYDVVMGVVKDPSSYGFENAENGCCATGLFEMGYACNRNNPFTCRDASTYVFWDAFHPTERASSIIANYLMNTSLAVFK